MRIVLSRIGLRFADRVVLDGADLAVEQGVSTALMGPSGSGKSSLLAILAGLLPATTGTRLLEGTLVPDFAWVMQTTPLLRRRTALDNVVLGARCAGTGQAEADQQARRAMVALDIDELSETPAYRLSGGERQRITIARAMATGADFLLADEPTAALDAANRDQVAGNLVTAARGACGVVVATHDPVVAARCDRVVRLLDGRLIGD